MSESQEQPIPAKSEISFLATEANKTKVDKVLQKPKKGISKKQLAQRLIASAVIAAGVGISADDVSRGSLMEEPKGVYREVSVQDLEQRVEQSHQIKIISPRESEVFTLHNGEQVKTEEWTKEQLTDFGGFLDKLPPHFYLPAPKMDRFYLRAWGFGGTDMTESKLQQLYNDAHMSDLKEHFGKDFKISKEQLRKAISQRYFERQEGVLPVSFILTDDLPANRKFGVNAEGKTIEEVYIAYCYCETSSTNPEVLFSLSAFRRDSVGKFKTVVHELTHRISSEEDYKFVRELLEVNQGESFGSSRNSDFKLKDLDKIRYQRDILKVAGINEWRADAKFNYGMSGGPHEFVSVASEFYVGGKDIFMALYSIHIGEEKAVGLYDYMRDNLFKGTEYKNYQIINK